MMSTKNKSHHHPLSSLEVKIKGLHCVSCETLIADDLKDISGVKNVKVNHRTGVAEIFYQGDKPDLGVIKSRLKKMNYNLVDGSVDDQTTGDRVGQGSWLTPFALVLLLYLVYRFFHGVGWLNWLEVDTQNITFGVALLIGVVASLSTCLAVVGSVVMSFAAKYQARGSFYQANIQPHLLFHLGRLVTFFILGGVLGAVGSWFKISTAGWGWVTIVMSLIFVWLGLNILGLVPSVSRLGLRLPQKTLDVWQRWKKSEHALAPVFLGGLTFFLPCGFTQSMQLFALAAGSFWAGALTLFLFALGTLPVLFGLGVATSRVKNLKSKTFVRAVGLIVVIFAFYMLSSGLALLGVARPSFSLSNNSTGATVSNGSEQVINMSVDYNGYTPNVFYLKRGVPVRWVINGQQITSCTSEIIVPELNIDRKLTTGDNIITFTPNKVGEISFSCWMGMVRGKFIVSEAGAADATQQSLSAVDPNLKSSGSCGCGRR